MPPREYVAPPEERFPGYRRVTWLPGDPDRERARWSRDARAFAKSMKRPVVVALIAAIEPVLHSTDGYSWISNEALRDDMGAKHASAVERALLEAVKLGVIERETKTIVGPVGGVWGRTRRIFATRHRGLDEVEDRIRAKKEARVASRSSGTEIRQIKNHDFGQIHPSKNNGLAGLCEVGSVEPRISVHRRLNRTTSESGNNQEPAFTIERKNTDRSQLRMGEAMARGQTSSHVSSALDALARIGPECGRDQRGEYEEVLEAGRRCWRALHDPRTTSSDAAILLADARDAVRRSWTDHDPKIAGMLAHLTKAAGGRVDQDLGPGDFRRPNPTTATGGR